MLIIDADTHIAPTGGDFALDAHMERVARAGIDKTLTWLKPDYTGTEIEGHLKYVYDAATKYPDVILPFGWADPTVGVDHAKKMVALCTEEYGFYGVKLNGAQNDYRIDDPVLALPIIEEIAKVGAILAFHIGADFYENTHPFRAERVARMYPEMPILMVHMGMTDWEMNRAVVEIANRCPNMYLVGSATTDKAIMHAINVLGADRVLFGSDAPFQRPHVVHAMYEAGLRDLADEDKALVMGGNAARLFKL